MDLNKPNRIDSMHERRMRFAAEYIVDMVGSKAAVRAGYSPNNSADTAWDLLQRDDVKAEVARLTALRSAKYELTVKRVLLELSRLALADPRNYYKVDEDGKVVTKPIHELTDDEAAAVSEYIVSTDRNGKTKTTHKLADKTKALELLSRHFGLLDDKLTIKGLSEEDRAERFAKRFAEFAENKARGFTSGSED